MCTLGMAGLSMNGFMRVYAEVNLYDSMCYSGGIVGVKNLTNKIISGRLSMSDNSYLLSSKFNNRFKPNY